jgi:hypothetical protein
MVGMTSVGSGSLVIILLMLLYPRLSANTQVGTNLVQAVPLVAAATLGQLLFGHVSLTVSSDLMIGSIPGAFFGARISSRAPEALVRHVLVVLLVASGLALLITSYVGLAIALVLSAAVGTALWGALDATLLLSRDWDSAGHDRTRWVAAMALLAPLGAGTVATLLYAVKVRPKVLGVARLREFDAAGQPAAVPVAA